MKAHGCPWFLPGAVAIVFASAALPACGPTSGEASSGPASQSSGMVAGSTADDPVDAADTADAADAAAGDAACGPYCYGHGRAYYHGKPWSWSSSNDKWDLQIVINGDPNKACNGRVSATSVPGVPNGFVLKPLVTGCLPLKAGVHVIRAIKDAFTVRAAKIKSPGGLWWVKWGKVPFANDRRGTTWTVELHDSISGLDKVGCDAHCNPYVGDTPCDMELPLLCLDKDGSSTPLFPPPYSFYDGWAHGHICATQPHRGDELATIDIANLACEKECGPGYKTAEHHDGDGGWHWRAFGHITLSDYFWVDINDQPGGNCWDRKPSPPDAPKLSD